MSFVPIIRDYIEVINSLSSNNVQLLEPIQFFKVTGIYILQTLKLGCIYLVTFQWLRDFTLLPINIPNISVSLLNERIFLEIHLLLSFNHRQRPQFHQNIHQILLVFHHHIDIFVGAWCFVKVFLTTNGMENAFFIQF